MQAIEGITPDNLWTFMIVLVGLATITLLFLNLSKAIKEAKDPKEKASRTVEEKLDNDNRRIIELEKENKITQKEMNLLLKSQMVILQHMITGDHINDLQKTLEEIQTYLIER